MRRTSPPGKRSFIVFDRYCIEFDGPRKGFKLQRNPALLPGIAQKHRVSINAVAHQFCGRSIGVERTHTRWTDGACYFSLTGGARVLPRTIVHKRGGRCSVRVQRDVGSAA